MISSQNLSFPCSASLIKWCYQPPRHKPGISPRVLFSLHQHFQYMSKLHRFYLSTTSLCYHFFNRSLASSPVSLFFSMSPVLFSFKCHQSALKTSFIFPLFRVPTALLMAYKMRSKFLIMTQNRPSRICRLF